MTAGHGRVLVAVTCDERGAALLVQHPGYSVVLTLPAPSGTGATSVYAWPAPVDDGGMADPLLLDVTEVGRRLSVSERLARTLIADGALPSVQVGRRRLVRAVDLGHYVEALGRPEHAIPVGAAPGHDGPGSSTSGDRDGIEAPLRSTPPATSTDHRQGSHP